MEKRQELVNQLTMVNAQADSIRKQIDAIDHADRLAEAKQYEGKCFQQINKYHSESIDCVFVYGTDVERCEPKAIVVRYWTGKEDTWFTLEYHSHFHPKRYDEEDKYVEITKEEFLKHYHAVQERIEKASGQTALKISELEESLEREATLITEAIGDVFTICRMNDEDVAKDLIRKQFVVIDRQDINNE